jgi:hypothetical protein
VLVRDLQRLLESFYGIDIGADVRDYLVTSAAELRVLENDTAARETEEKLLLEQTASDLGVALYLDGALLERLAAMDPRERLCVSNLGDFCTALEGVSHFNYLAWNAAMDKTVTLLELEMQAEIDKYIGARMLLGQQPASDISNHLLATLFDSPVFDARLAPQERRRYEDACHFAGRYCHSLQCRFPAGTPGSAMVRELRAFFRWPQPAKVSHIRSALLS